MSFNSILRRSAQIVTARRHKLHGSIDRYVKYSRHIKYLKGLSSPARALAWLEAQELPTGGIRVHSKHSDPYQEVSGYLVPTLIRYGEKALAIRIISWLMCIQRAAGSYTGPDGAPYIFDTGQALRGLLAGAEFVPDAGDAARRAADYIYHQMLDSGNGGFESRYSGTIPE
ncbi:MAG: hypothetical protein JRJ85_28000, partial [Deltaproteobacteria bacterium]|nr:hypothetical protein [Deltaproteobacteria bacterium]